MANEKSEYEKKMDASLAFIKANRADYDPIINLLDTYLKSWRGMTNDELIRRLSYDLSECEWTIRKRLDTIATSEIKMNDNEGGICTLKNSEVTVWKLKNANNYE